jgi:hypothetical protein
MRLSSGLAETAQGSVRTVDFQEAPELAPLAEQARRLADEAYPRVLALLWDTKARPPRQVRIVFKRHLTQETARAAERFQHDTMQGLTVAGAAYRYSCLVKGSTIYMDAEALAKNPGALTGNLVHELTHVAQQYAGRKRPFYWIEGIADYVPWKLGYTNNAGCPQCSAYFPHYTNGYACAAAFLLYLDANWGTHVIRQLNSELRRGSYSEEFFWNATGLELAQLWHQFQQTPGYTAEAEEMLKLRASLFPSGRPAKGADARVAAYIKSQPGGAFTLDAIEFLAALGRRNQLPGLPKGTKGEWLLTIEPLRPVAVENYPISRTLKYVKRGDPAPYFYTVERLSPDAPWKLSKAWQATFDGRIVAEFDVP